MYRGIMPYSSKAGGKPKVFPQGFNGARGLLEPANGIKPWYKETKEFFRGRQYSKAIEYANKTLKETPSFAPAYVFMGKAYAKLGKDELAQEAFENAIKSSSSSSLGYLELVHLKIINRRYLEAREIAKKVVAKHPKHALAYLRLGTCEFRLENYESSIYYFLKSLELGLSNISPHNFLMRAYAYCSKENFAIMHYNIENSISPRQTAETSSFLAAAFLDAGQYDNAIKYYSIAISLKPNNGFFYNERGRAYLYKENFHEALSDFERAAQLIPKSPFPYKNMGIVLFYAELYEESAKLLKKSAGINYEPETLYYLAMAHLGMRDNGKFAEVMQKAIRIEKNPEKKRRYGLILEKEDTLAKAHRTREYLRQYLMQEVTGKERKNIGFIVKGK